MTPTCHYDPTLGHHVTREHRDTCTTPDTHNGCAPCTANHCLVCRRTHATNDHPHTCPRCTDKIRDDLHAINDTYNDLAHEAVDGTRNGRLNAAAPIPGGTPAILRGPTTPTGHTTHHPDHHLDHHPDDPTPPLAILTAWTHTLTAFTAPTTVGGCIRLLDTHLTDLAQHADPEQWRAFTVAARALRTMLDRAIHNEQAPEHGVECFDCNVQLVRRFRDPARCRHSTPARRELQMWLTNGYPEAVTDGLVREARKSCGGCDQGGIKDPTVGLSWECPGCRRDFTAGEYAHAVRRDLLEGGEHGDGWTHIAMAAEAASTLTGGIVAAGTVRKWMDRGKVSSCCRWTPGRTLGVRLVFWPDVAEVSQAAMARAKRRAATAS